MNINEYSVTVQDPETMSVIGLKITATITNEQNEVVSTHQDPNALFFPACMAGWSQEQLAAFVSNCAQNILMINDGLMS